MRRNHLLVISVVLLMLASEATGQNPPTVTQEAKNSPCSNIVALTGDVKIDCSSLTPTQQKIIESIPSLLRKLIAHQADADAIIARLDECLKAVNPNLPAKAYFCNGGWRSTGIGANTGLQMNVSPGPDPSLGEMINLNNNHTQYQKLLEVCTSQIESNPEWLTPRLFCAIAYASLGNAAKAKEMIDVYDSRKGPAYDDDPLCKQVSDAIHTALK